MDLLDLLWSFLKESDWFALIIAGGLGFLAGIFVPAGWWSIYTSIFVSYHLFLGWLLITAENKVETTWPFGYSVAIHASCLAGLLLLGAGRLFIPHFDVICCGVAVLAFFERDWLFQPTKAVATNAEDTVISSAEEYKEWLDHLSKQGHDPRGTEGSRKEEFEWWLQARRSARAAERPSSGSHTH